MSHIGLATISSKSYRESTITSSRKTSNTSCDAFIWPLADSSSVVAHCAFVIQWGAINFRWVIKASTNACIGCGLWRMDLRLWMWTTMVRPQLPSSYILQRRLATFTVNLSQSLQLSILFFEYQPWTHSRNCSKSESTVFRFHLLV